MLSIKTFLKNGDFFTPIDEYDGKIADIDYIEGAIEIRTGNTYLVRKDVWDDVNFLWAYLLHGIQDLAEGKKKSTTLFPDQPIELSIERINTNQIKLSVSHPKPTIIVCSESDFFSVIIPAADTFISNIIRIEPKCEREYKEAIKQLNMLREKI